MSASWALRSTVFAMEFYFVPGGRRSAFSKLYREIAILRVGLFLPANFSVLSFAPVAAFETAQPRGEGKIL